MSKLVIQENGCALWEGYCNDGGYGMVRYQGRDRRVHVLLYEHFVGAIPAGYDLHHYHCERRNCGNFMHVQPLTHAEHARLSKMTRENSAKAYCPSGHPYNSDNTYLNAKGWRRCAECIRAKHRADYREARAAQGRSVGPPKGQESHCPAGHPYEGANLYQDQHGHRQCVTCRAFHNKKPRPSRQKAARRKAADD